MRRFTASSRPLGRNRRAAARPVLESLEPRHLLDGGLANVLVNSPVEDATVQDTQSETAIVLGAGSKIVVAYNDDGITSAVTPALTGYSTSANGGASFADQGSLPLNHDVGDPVLARSSKTGTIFLSNLGVDSAYYNSDPPPPILFVGQEQVNVFRSTNNGAAFQAPVNATPSFVANVDITDKPWITVDNFPGPGYGNVYLVTRDIFQVSGVWNTDIVLTRSTDDGLTWGAPTLIAPPGPNPTTGPNVTVGPDHAVYVFWWSADKFTKWATNPQIVMRKSADQGVTFGDPVTVTGLRTYYYGGDLLLTDGAAHYFTTNAFPQAVVNPVTGDIYVAFDDWGNGSWNGKDKGNIYFTQSSDGGQTWSKPVQVNDDLTNNDQWLPALAVTPDGSHVGLFWYDRRLDPANNLIDRFGAIGTVSAHTVTFGANFRITDMSFPPAFTYWNGTGWHIQDPLIRPGYMGDYDQATADNNCFYTTWGDNRLPDAYFANQPDVRFAKIPVGWTGMVSAGNSFDAFFSAANGADPGDTFFRDPVAAPLGVPAPALIAAVAAVTEPAAVFSSEASSKGLAVDAYFMEPTPTNQETGSLTDGDTTPWRSFGLVPPAQAAELAPWDPARSAETAVEGLFAALVGPRRRHVE